MANAWHASVTRVLEAPEHQFTQRHALEWLGGCDQLEEWKTIRITRDNAETPGFDREGILNPRSWPE